MEGFDEKLIISFIDMTQTSRGDEQTVATLDSLHDTRRAEQMTFLRSQPVENNDVEDPLDLRIASIRSSLERESQNAQADEFGEGRNEARKTPGARPQLRPEATVAINPCTPF
jgi:hypothetical protein